jgi:hypothetical protein
VRAAFSGDQRTQRSQRVSSPAKAAQT